MNTMSAEEILEKHIGKIPVYNKEVYSGVIAAMKEFASLSSTPTGEDVEALAEKIAKEWDIYWTESGEVSCNSLEAIKAALQNKVPVEPKEWESQLKEIWQSIESVDDAIYFIKQYFTETNGYDALLKEYHEFVDKVPVECYVPVSALEKPETDGWYFVVMEGVEHGRYALYFNSEKWYNYHQLNFSHWLKKTTLPNTTIK